MYTLLFAGEWHALLPATLTRTMKGCAPLGVPDSALLLLLQQLLQQLLLLLLQQLLQQLLLLLLQQLKLIEKQNELANGVWFGNKI